MKYEMKWYALNWVYLGLGYVFIGIKIKMVFRHT